MKTPCSMKHRHGTSKENLKSRKKNYHYKTITTRRGWNTDYAGEKYAISEFDFKYSSSLFLNVATLAF